MKVAVIITESEMEELWKKTSFARLFDRNPFELAYDDGSDYPYQKIDLRDGYDHNTNKMNPIYLLDDSFFEKGMRRNYKLEMEQAILRWINDGLIPHTYYVMVERDY